MSYVSLRLDLAIYSEKHFRIGTIGSVFNSALPRWYLIWSCRKCFKILLLYRAQHGHTMYIRVVALFSVQAVHDTYCVISSSHSGSPYLPSQSAVAQCTQLFGWASIQLLNNGPHPTARLQWNSKSSESFINSNESSYGAATRSPTPLPLWMICSSGSTFFGFFWRVSIISRWGCGLLNTFVFPKTARWSSFDHSFQVCDAYVFTSVST